jgi:phage terminase large subunit-like protein
MTEQTPQRRNSKRSLKPRVERKSEGNLVAEFIETFCRLSKGDGAGNLIKLRPWQREILDELFELKEDGRRRKRRGLLLLPRKNGKSLLASGIALYSLFTEVGAYVGVVASDRAQARIVFRECARMVELDPVLSSKLRVLRDVIEYPETGSVLRVLSSDSDAAEGYDFSALIFDELHTQPNDRLWATVNLGSGTRKNPLVLAISTAGSKTDAKGQDSICYRLFQYGQRLASGEIEDDSFYFRYFHASDSLEWDSPEAWQSANPAYGDFLDPEDFKSAVKSLPRDAFETKRLNRWLTAGAAAWLPAGVFDKCRSDRRLQPGEKIVAAWDGSFDGDASVLVASTLDAYIEPLLVFERPLDDPHWRVDIGDVEEAVLALRSKYEIVELCADPFRWQRSLERFAKEGMNVTEYPQSASRMVNCTQGAFESITQGTLTWGGEPVLAAALARHVDNARIKIDRFGPRLTKEGRSSPRKIDCAVALCMALDRARYYATEAAKPARSVGFFSL